jgi:hypothetical protein
MKNSTGICLLRYWLWATNKDDQEHRKDSFTHELLNSGTRKTYLPLLGTKAHFMPLSKVEWDFKNCDSETARGCVALVMRIQACQLTLAAHAFAHIS